MSTDRNGFSYGGSVSLNNGKVTDLGCVQRNLLNHDGSLRLEPKKELRLLYTL
jgi:hypothetical protein